MLQNVRNFWIKGVLEQSLYAVARLELGLTTQPDAVEDVWNVLVQRPDQTPQPLPPGTRISTAFDEFGRTLLILGAPGTGKTTLLLELTKDLLALAEHDPNHPLPVVFILSSWAVRQPPLAAWLVDELCERYQVPRKHAQTWIDKELILPLLDGLDEVAPECRSACAEAINEFRQQHGLVPMAVCSRLADYEALTVRLRLHGALVVQSLTHQQIDHYLAQAGKPLAGARAALQDDKTLWELLDTPLMLSIAALAYQGRSAAEVQSTGTLEKRKTQLFAAYTDAMFKRRGKAAPYSRQQTIRWLVWLAAAMARQNQSMFYLEWLQPNWLPEQRLGGTELLVRRVVGLVVGLGGGLAVGLVAGLVFGLAVGLVAGLVFGLGSATVSVTDKRVQPAETLTWRWSRFKQAVDISSHVLDFELDVGLNGGLAVGLLSGLVVGLGGGLVVGLGGGLAVGLGSGLVISFGVGMGSGPVSGTLSGLAVGLLGWLLGGLDFGLAVGLGSGLVVGLLGWLLGGLSQALVTGEITTRGRPNEGMWRSLHNALLSGLLGGLVVGLLSGLVVGLGGGLLSGLVVGLEKGGNACLQHLILRLLLWRNNYAPWHYVRFLDYAAERVFLRKVGGGYIFIHRMLLEYFATLYPSNSEHKGKASEPV